ncbi:MAG: hypothetical protein C5B51_07030 [Terriglobia bacterium]|nr:MAG: hypothetical protein C5B51_07030 [Terriglobia bacterium]
MAISVVMPALELAQETGKILSWIKNEGDSITKGEPIVEIETDKITFEVEAPGDGVLAGIRSHAGEDVPVGQTIAWIVAPGEAPPAEAETAAPAARTMTATVAPVAEAPKARPAATAPEPATKVSPKAKRLAKELGVDLSRVRGTGPDGAITSEDVEAAAKAPAPAPQESTALSAIARLMAERTAQSWTTAPHFFLTRELDAGALVDARERLGKAAVTHTDLLVALVARVLLKHPKMNASWTGSGIQLHPQVNISVAMAVTDGVVGAVIPNAATASIQDIAALRKELTERARSGHLRPQDVTGGTFTISNLGMYGIDAFTAIITPPQAAILAVGRIADRVVPVDGKPGIRPMLTMTLSSDHRVVDGAQAALFLNDLAEAIREPGNVL